MTVNYDQMLQGQNTLGTDFSPWPDSYKNEVNIPNPVEIAFDPESLEGIMKQVFDDTLARTLWLAIKSNHYVSQYFDEGCLIAAHTLQQSGMPTDLDEIGAIIGRCTFIRYSYAFLRKLQPYLQDPEALKLQYTAKTEQLLEQRS